MNKSSVDDFSIQLVSVTRFPRVEEGKDRYATLRSKSVESLRESSHWDNLIYKMQDDFKKQLYDQQEDPPNDTKAD